MARDPGLMARWIVGADRAESQDGHVRLTVATRVARWHVAATYSGETVERTPERFVRRYIDDQDEVSIDRTITYELKRTPAGCKLTSSVITGGAGGHYAMGIAVIQASGIETIKHLVGLAQYFGVRAYVITDKDGVHKPGGQGKRVLLEILKARDPAPSQSELQALHGLRMQRYRT